MFLFNLLNTITHEFWFIKWLSFAERGLSQLTTGVTSSWHLRNIRQRLRLVSNFPKKLQLL